MRSVVFHLTGTTQQEVAEWLSVIALPNGSDLYPWLWPAGQDSQVLYLYFYGSLELEAEPEELDLLRASLGEMPAVSVIANVSGQVPGDTEIRKFAALILGKFRGVAWDDYTSHCWTLAEIQSGVKVKGHPFFDYRGWYRDEHPELAAES